MPTDKQIVNYLDLKIKEHIDEAERQQDLIKGQPEYRVAMFASTINTHLSSVEALEDVKKYLSDAATPVPVTPKKTEPVIEA
jgi:hypothetical protein